MALDTWDEARGAQVAALAVFVAACGAGSGSGSGSGSASGPGPVASLCEAYFADSGARRAAIVRSLVNPSNGYSQLRLEHYDTGDAQDWSLLPESNPPSELVAAAELDQPGGVSVGSSVGPDAHAVAIPDAALGCDAAALVLLGEEAFFHYPVQVSVAAETATVSRGSFSRYGFWVDDTHGAGGLVRQATPDGSSVLAFTCSTCHAGSPDGELVIGVGNAELDIGRLTFEATANPDPAVAANLLAWGPGRLDVTTEDGTEPVRLADTRPVRWLGFLQADATVAVEDVMTVAIRLETLIITSHLSQDRPPRAIALGLAMYLEALGASLPAANPTTPAQVHGANLFASTCAGCHVPPSLTGAPVPLDVVGTNPTVGLSPNRGTGAYRVPSLHGVSTRGPLLHDASLHDLAAMFDPSRVLATYRGGRLGAGPVPGHVFGLDMSDGDRADLVAYLQTL